ncbi:sperm-associated antigen 11B-like [Phyllostomus hastatus]|uniref:sperm-associated antigen 11B-like n=1 Tax=Phyllostomus hastatus TaxID=9423 RepID=UPI001E683601|nr:sperm-associated antigen 11B-like [Phyllostomus hastatus]
MERLLPCTLLVALLLPGLSRAGHDNHHDVAGPGAPTEEARAQGTNKSQVFRHQVKRRYLARVPPFPDPEPHFQVVDCQRGEGRCQEYCNYMETQVGYCSKKKEACCVIPA